MAQSIDDCLNFGQIVTLGGRSDGEQDRVGLNTIRTSRPRERHWELGGGAGWQSRINAALRKAVGL